MSIQPKLASEASLSLILPCFNEEQSISPVVTEVLEFKDHFLAETQLKDLEVIVVDDGSTDASREELNQFSSQIRILSLPKNSGYGSALKAGFKIARGDYFAFFDLDQTCSVKDLLPMFNLIHDENVDLVLGDRLSQAKGMPKIRRIGNQLYHWAAKVLLNSPLHDCCTGFRIFKRELAEDFDSKLPNDLDFSIAMTAYCIRNKYAVREIPISYGERTGESKLNAFEDGPIFLYRLIQYSLF